MTNAFLQTNQQTSKQHNTTHHVAYVRTYLYQVPGISDKAPPLYSQKNNTTLNWTTILRTLGYKYQYRTVLISTPRVTNVITSRMQQIRRLPSTKHASKKSLRRGGGTLNQSSKNLKSRRNARKSIRIPPHQFQVILQDSKNVGFS